MQNSFYRRFTPFCLGNRHSHCAALQGCCDNKCSAVIVQVVQINNIARHFHIADDCRSVLGTRSPVYCECGDFCVTWFIVHRRTSIIRDDSSLPNMKSIYSGAIGFVHPSRARSLMEIYFGKSFPVSVRLIINFNSIATRDGCAFEVSAAKAQRTDRNGKLRRNVSQVFKQILE